MKQTTPTIQKTIAKYSMLKRIEKRLADKLDVERQKILNYAGNQAEVLVFNDSKLASILELERQGLDVKAMREQVPLIYSQFSKVTRYLTVKLH